MRCVPYYMTYLVASADRALYRRVGPPGVERAAAAAALRKMRRVLDTAPRRLTLRGAVVGRGTCCSPHHTTSQDADQLHNRGLKRRWMTWAAIGGRPCAVALLPLSAERLVLESVPAAALAQTHPPLPSDRHLSARGANLGQPSVPPPDDGGGDGGSRGKTKTKTKTTEDTRDTKSAAAVLSEDPLSASLAAAARAGVVMSAGAFACLAGNAAGRLGRAWELPVTVGPGTYCSPRHRMPCNSTKEGSECVG